MIVRRLLAACGGSGPTGPRYRVATAVDAGNSNLAGLSGVVHGRANGDGTACFWIEYAAKPGTPAGRVALVWPDGSRAYAHPLRVVSAEGDVIATAGRSADGVDSRG